MPSKRLRSEGYTLSLSRESMMRSKKDEWQTKMLKTEEEKQRGYSDATQKLLEKIEAINLRKDFYLDKKKVEEAVARAYTIAGLAIPKFDWRVDVIDEDFGRAARTAGAARAAWAAGTARAARAAGAARAARAAWAAWAAGAAGTASIDYDFDCFVQEFEFLKHEKGNDNDKKTLKIYQEFLKAREAGLGYLADYDTNGICYLVPAPRVSFIENNFHSERGPAIEWKDGLQCYFLKGIAFEKNLWQKIVDRTLTSKEALTIQSTDQRAIALQYIGGEKLMADFGGKVIGKDEYGELIELTELKDGNDQPYKYLKAFDPDKGDYIWLRTRPEFTSPAEAEAWSYDLSRWSLKYKPTSRT